MKKLVETIQDLSVEVLDAALEFKYKLKDEVSFFVGNEKYEIESMQDNKAYGNDNNCLIINLHKVKIDKELK